MASATPGKTFKLGGIDWSAVSGDTDRCSLFARYDVRFVTEGLNPLADAFDVLARLPGPS